MSPGAEIQHLDQSLFLWLNGARHPALDWVMPHLSDLNAVLPVLIAVVLWRLWRGDTRERVMWLGLVAVFLLGDMFCAKVLKPLIHRPRPYETLVGIHVFRRHEWWITTQAFVAGMKGHTLSWPSCHATNISSAAAFLSTYHPRWALPLVALALGVCYSRIYLGQHYPLDVLGGAVVGSLWGWTAASFLSRRTPTSPRGGKA